MLGGSVTGAYIWNKAAEAKAERVVEEKKGDAAIVREGVEVVKRGR